MKCKNCSHFKDDNPATYCWKPGTHIGYRGSNAMEKRWPCTYSPEWVLKRPDDYCTGCYERRDLGNNVVIGANSSLNGPTDDRPRNMGLGGDALKGGD